MKTSQELEEFIKTNNLTEKGVRIHYFAESTHTADEAARLLGVSPAQIIKSLVVVMGTEAYLVIVPGNKKFNQKLIRKAVKTFWNNSATDSRLATMEEVLNLTGYPIGAVPPITVSLQVIIDQAVLAEGIVFGGGGSTNSILEIPTSELLLLTQARAFAISKSTDH
jgi:prolyl-tRNA editing enzyme YbaK/EbsC (Cys-tRNA(Pro) deacylase)